MVEKSFVQDLYLLGENLYDDVRQLGLITAGVMAADFVIPLPTDYNNGTAPGYDLAFASGLTRRPGGSVIGLALSMTPELVASLKGGNYGDLSTRALTKLVTYGIASLIVEGTKAIRNKKFSLPKMP